MSARPLECRIAAVHAASRSRTDVLPSLATSAVTSLVSSVARSCHPPHETVDALEQQRDEHDDDDEIDLRDHRAVTDVRAITVFAKDEAGDRVGRPAWPAGGDVDDDVGE